jgi:hypothetical protein
MAKRALEKHMGFFRVLDEVQRADGRALCRLEEKDTERYFDGLLYERVTDPGIRLALRESGGFCPRHAHVLLRFSDSLGTAILYEDQIRALLKDVRSVPASRPRRSLGRSGVRARGICPACAHERQLREHFCQTLVAGLEDPEMTAAYGNSPGLCYPHFTVALDKAAGDTRQLLARCQTERLVALESQLNELQRKHDHRHSREGMGPERDSWLLAVEMVVGKPEVFG